ncbi:MAG: stage sporulation protein [Bacilli bacterium]|nr:stage sporulation protein [Bacilli bacterium]
MSERYIPTIYIRFRKHIRIGKGEPIVLGRIADLLSEPEIEAKLNRHIIYYPSPQDGNRVLIDMLKVIRSIHKIYPVVQIEHFGDPHVLVEIATGKARPHFLILALVWLLLFIGSGLTILNFHADVSMLQVHRRIYELLTGRSIAHPYLLQIPYSIGIGAGMVLFFNHLFKKKFNEEPSPLEVEMFLYQESSNRYVITEEYGKIRKRKDLADHDNGT